MARRLAKRFLSREEFAKAPSAGASLRKLYQPTIEPIAETRSIRFTISTDGIDRDNDMISAAGWDLSNYQKNPVVLWAHQYDQLPVGKATNLRIEQGKLVADAEFVPADVYPFAETVYRMLKGGFLGSTSVGFKPKDFTFNEKRQGFDFAAQELLEFSIVPIPANPEALLDMRAAGVLDDGDVEAYVKWAHDALTVVKGVGSWRVFRVPVWANADKAEVKTAWAVPDLAAYTEKAWGTLTEPERKALASHFAWAEHYPPRDFTDLKFPHHDPVSGKANLVAVLDGLASLATSTAYKPDERAAISEHLAGHFALKVASPSTPMDDVWVALFPGLVAKEMPAPSDDEDEQAFVSRCMGDEAMQGEYPEQDQRAAVCYAQHRRGSKAIAKTVKAKAMDGCQRGDACPMQEGMEYCPAGDDCPMDKGQKKILADTVTKTHEAKLRQAALLLTEVLGTLGPTTSSGEPEPTKSPDVILVLDEEPMDVGLDALDAATMRELISRAVDSTFDAIRKESLTRTTGELD